MNPQSNAKTSAKSQSIIDAHAASYKTIIQMQPISDLSNIFLIQHAGKSPPGCSRSSGSSLRLYPDTNRNARKSNNINNKEEFYTLKSKANFIF